MHVLVWLSYQSARVLATVLGVLLECAALSGRGRAHRRLRGRVVWSVYGHGARGVSWWKSAGKVRGDSECGGSRRGHLEDSGRTSFGPGDPEERLQLRPQLDLCLVPFIPRSYTESPPAITSCITLTTRR
uniref:Secreted protein n=1 Tax=Knipowitschia caucasica TaxID=637954 RepID=A0AAV2K3F5_KNICA